MGWPEISRLKVTVCRFVSNPPLTGSRPLGEICYRSRERKLEGEVLNFQSSLERESASSMF